MVGEPGSLFSHILFLNYEVISSHFAHKFLSYEGSNNLVVQVFMREKVTQSYLQELLPDPGPFWYTNALL